MNGFLNLLKPPGMTSSNAVQRIRRMLSGEKIGHAGTLDPEAAGVLPIMVGKATRLFDVLTEKEKAYVAEISFGRSTDTQDAQGETLAESTDIPSMEALRAVLPQFVGNIMQTPPNYSALKVGGRPAYALARKGESVLLEKRPARIDAIDFLEKTGENTALFFVACGKGVYIRTLCHDIGERLSCPAHLRFLLRTKSGMFTIENSVTLEEWEASEDRASLLAPLDAPLSHLPLLRVEENRRAAIRSGNPPARGETTEAAFREAGPVRIYCGDVFAGLARWQGDTLRFQAMLME